MYLNKGNKFAGFGERAFAGFGGDVAFDAVGVKEIEPRVFVGGSPKFCGSCDAAGTIFVINN